MNGPEQQAGPGQQTDAGQPVDGTQAANAGRPTSVEQPAGQPVTYEAASARVEEIIRRLDSGEASLDETLELLSEGKSLIELCAQQLTAVGGALEELRLDELVSRLEREAGA
jgi:exodeoxyribonuclease VII small subunit